MTTGEDWRGRVGREWAAADAALEGILRGAGAAGLDRLRARPGERVLDLGCGSGRTALALAGAGAEVTGIDLSPDLLALARARPGAERVRWVEGDAAREVFPAPFDALFSRCGSMFFEDPGAAFVHLRHQMVPGGRAVLVAWADMRANGWATVPLAAAEPILGTAARAGPGTGPGPFAWADPRAFAPVLRGAGWREVAWEGVETVARLGEAGEGAEEGRDEGGAEGGAASDPASRAAALCLRVGPLAARLRGSEPQLRAAVARLLREAFAARVVRGAVELPAAAWIVTARA